MDDYELTVIFTSQVVLLLIKRYIIFFVNSFSSIYIQLHHELHGKSHRPRYSSSMVRFQPLHFHAHTYVHIYIHVERMLTWRVCSHGKKNATRRNDEKREWKPSGDPADRNLSAFSWKVSIRKRRADASFAMCVSTYFLSQKGTVLLGQLSKHIAGTRNYLHQRKSFFLCWTMLSMGSAYNGDWCVCHESDATIFVMSKCWLLHQL